LADQLNATDVDVTDVNAKLTGLTANVTAMAPADAELPAVLNASTVYAP
jgi:hypothetical protein